MGLRVKVVDFNDEPARGGVYRVGFASFRGLGVRS